MFAEENSSSEENFVNKENSNLDDQVFVDLLPPKFVVDQGAAEMVVLPSADGGTQVIDSSVVSIRHNNQTVTLKALSPKQKSRMRLIQNVVVLVLAGLMLVAAVWILL